MAYNISLSVGYRHKVVDAATTTGTANSVIFSPVIKTGESKQLKLDAVITNFVACSGKLQTRPDDTVDWIDHSPDNSIDFTLPSQLITIGPGQYRVELDTMTSDSVDIYASLG